MIEKTKQNKKTLRARAKLPAPIAVLPQSPTSVVAMTTTKPPPPPPMALLFLSTIAQPLVFDFVFVVCFDCELSILFCSRLCSIRWAWLRLWRHRLRHLKRLRHRYWPISNDCVVWLLLEHIGTYFFFLNFFFASLTRFRRVNENNVETPFGGDVSALYVYRNSTNVKTKKKQFSFLIS